MGGSQGIALLSTLSASAARNHLHSHVGTANAAANATLHSYAVAYWVTAGIFTTGAFTTGAIIVGAAYRPGNETPAVDKFDLQSDAQQTVVANQPCCGEAW